MDTRTAQPNQTPEMAAESRKQRGAILAQRVRITAKRPGLYVVPAASNPGHYIVETEGAQATCSCPDYELRHSPCKHVWAVEYQRRSETMQDGTTKTVETLKVTYTQSWPEYNAAQTNEKDEAARLLYALCATIPQPEQKMGRPTLPISDTTFAAVMKVWGGLSGRRSAGSLGFPKTREALGSIRKRSVPSRPATAVRALVIDWITGTCA